MHRPLYYTVSVYSDIYSICHVRKVSPKFLPLLLNGNVSFDWCMSPTLSHL